MFRENLMISRWLLVFQSMLVVIVTGLHLFSSRMVETWTACISVPACWTACIVLCLYCNLLSIRASRELININTSSFIFFPGMTTKKCCTTPLFVWCLEDAAWAPSASSRLYRWRSFCLGSLHDRFVGRVLIHVLYCLVLFNSSEFTW